MVMYAQDWQRVGGYHWMPERPKWKRVNFGNAPLCEMSFCRECGLKRREDDKREWVIIRAATGAIILDRLTFKDAMDGARGLVRTFNPNQRKSAAMAAPADFVWSEYLIRDDMFNDYDDDVVVF